MRGFLIALICLCLAFSADAQARSLAPLLDIQEIETSKGLKAWLVEDHSLPIISLQFYFKGAGSIHDGIDKQGLARMVSNTMDEGAGDLDAQAFQKALQDHSITLAYAAGRDGFSGEFKTLSQYKDKGFALLKLSLTQPRFEEEAIVRMRASNQSRVRRALTDPDWIAARLMNDRAFEGHPYAYNSGGTLSSLDAITRDDLIAFHRDRLGQNNLVIAAAGDITKEELARVLDDLFSDLPTVPSQRSEKFEMKNAGSLYVFEQDIPQTIIQIMQPGIDRKDARYHTAQVMNFILGSSGFSSRLMEEIREKRGLTYGIYSGLTNMESFDGLRISTSTANENVSEMLSLIKNEWKKMKETAVSEAELHNAQSYLIGSLPLSLTSTSAISSLLLSLQIDDLPLDYLDQRAVKIQNTRVHDIQNLADTLLNSDQFITILVGQPENIKGQTIEDLPNAE